MSRRTRSLPSDTRRKAPRPASPLDTGSLAGGGVALRVWLCAAAVAVLTALPYFQVAGHQFVNFDDNIHVTANPHVQSGLTWDNLGWAFSLGSPSQWHPLTWMSHQLDCQLFGVSAGPHHLVNLFLHTMTAMILFSFLRECTGAIWPSALAALLFGLHPLNVEVVAWVAQRKTLLSGLFGVLTLWSHVRFARTDGRNWYLATLLCFTLSLAAKPMLLGLPALLLILDFWPLARVASLSAGRLSPTTAMTTRSLPALLLEKVPFAALAIASAGMTLACHTSHSVQIRDPGNLTVRLANGVMGYLFYLWKTVWPFELAFSGEYEPAAFSTVAVLLTAAGLVAFSAIAWRIRGRLPVLLVGWLWFLGMMFPVIGVIPIGTQRLADRYAYFPLIGLFLAVSWIIGTVHNGRPNRRYAILTLAACAVVGLGMTTRIQAACWRNSAALFEHTLQVVGSEHLAHNNLGDAYHKAGRLNEAAEQFRLALEIAPDDANCHCNLGIVLKDSGQFSAAEEHLRRAVTRAPENIVYLTELGSVLLLQNRSGETLPYFRRAVELQPDAAMLLNNYGTALAVSGEMEAAVIQFQQAVDCDPAYTEAHHNLARALRNVGRVAEAVHHFQKAQSLGASRLAVNRHSVVPHESRVR